MESSQTGPRIAAAVLSVILAIVCVIVVIVMADVGDKGTCEGIDPAAIRGTYECYEFSESVKPIVLAAGWIGGVLTGVAALLSLGFAIRGRGGRILLMTTAAAAFLLAVSILSAQLS
jgi:hypothetical protein